MSLCCVRVMKEVISTGKKPGFLRFGIYFLEDSPLFRLLETFEIFKLSCFRQNSPFGDVCHSIRKFCQQKKQTKSVRKTETAIQDFRVGD